MPNLDTSNLDTLTPEHYRVLTAVEMGLRNHDYVPLPLLCTIASISRGSVPKLTNDLLRIKLLTHVGGSADGYSLSYAGYDYLALKVLQRRGVVRELGSRIGVGKEADVYIGLAPDGSPVVLKFHKLGRTSFKTAKTKRDYMGHRQSASWMYLSRLAALREFGFMVALHQRGFSVPEPKSVNRHCVAMQHVEGAPMHTLRALTPALAQHLAGLLYQVMVRMLSYGVVHGDCNEFNVIVQGFDVEAEAQAGAEAQADTEAEAGAEAEAERAGATGRAGTTDAADVAGTPGAPADTPGVSPPLSPEERAVMRAMRVVVIDFPQMIQTTHPDAEAQFNRDVDSFVAFLNRRVHADIRVPRYAEAVVEAERLREERLRAQRAGEQAEAGATEARGEQADPARGSPGGPGRPPLAGLAVGDIQATERFVKDIAAAYDQMDPEDAASAARAAAEAGGAGEGAERGERGESGPEGPEGAEGAGDVEGSGDSGDSEGPEGDADEPDSEAAESLSDGPDLASPGPETDDPAREQAGSDGPADGADPARPAVPAARRRRFVDVRAAVKRQMQKEENKRVQRAKQRKGKSQGKPRLD